MISSRRQSSLTDCCEDRERMKDTEMERHYERERVAWNMPLSAHSRTIISQMGSAGRSPSPRRGSDQPRSIPNGAPRSREHSRPSSPSESIRSRATGGGGENRSRGSPHPRRDQQCRPPASPIPGSCILRPRTRSIHSNGLDTHSHRQAQIRHTPSQSSL